MKTTLQILKDARELISDEARWTQNAFGRNAVGEELWTDELDDAVCFCASGALIWAAGELGGAAYGLVTDTIGSGTLSVFNDTHTHAEVLAAFDEAIKLAEQEAR